MPRRALHKLGNEESGAAFVRPSVLTQPPVTDQSNCAGVGAGVVVGVADGSGEGDPPAVEKLEPTGLLLGDGLLIGTGAAWGRIVVTLAGAAAAAAACAPAFVLVVFVPVRAFVPICVAPVELPLELPSPPAAPPVIPPVELLIPVCAPALIPVRAPTIVFVPILGLLRKFVPV